MQGPAAGAEPVLRFRPALPHKQVVDLLVDLRIVEELHDRRLAVNMAGAEHFERSKQGVAFSFPTGDQPGLILSSSASCAITPQFHHGVLRFQRALSLLGSNTARVGVLAPTAVRANGMALDRMR